MKLHTALREVITDHPQSNSTICESYEIEPEIYRDLFAALLESDVFTRWQDEKADFHLRYIGGPGTGKTTLVAVAAEKLRGELNHPKNDAVVSIFISPRSKWNENALVQVLENIFIQLCTEQSVEPSSSCLASYASYLRKTLDNDVLDARLESLCAALESRINELHRIFLLIDGLDHCRRETAPHDYDSVDFETDLEKELKELKGFSSKIKLLSTSRVSRLQNDDFISLWWPSGTVSCDSEECRSPESGELETSVYWMCREECDYFSLCWMCHHQDVGCKNCNSPMNLRQTSNVCIDLNENRGLVSRLPDYVQWELNREYNQRSIQGNTPSDMLRFTGLNRRVEHVKKDKQVSASSVGDLSGGNIAIARLRLESEYFARDGLFVDEGLPREIVALFNAVVNGCSPLGIKAIAAVARLAEGKKYVSFDKLSEILTPGSYIECTQILVAAKGLLIAKQDPNHQHIEPRPLLIMPYNDKFFTFAKDRYNERINDAYEKMSDDLERIAREWERQWRSWEGIYDREELDED